MKMWVVRNFFFTSLLHFFQQTFIGLFFYHLFTIVLIRFQSFGRLFFCHVCNRSLCIISVEAEMAEE